MDATDFSVYTQIRNLGYMKLNSLVGKTGYIWRNMAGEGLLCIDCNQTLYAAS